MKNTKSKFTSKNSKITSEQGEEIPEQKSISFMEPIVEEIDTRNVFEKDLISIDEFSQTVEGPSPQNHNLLTILFYIRMTDKSEDEVIQVLKSSIHYVLKT